MKGKIILFLVFFTFFNSYMNSIGITQQSHFNYDNELKYTNFRSTWGIDTPIVDSKEWMPIEQSYTPKINTVFGKDNDSSSIIGFDCEKRFESKIDSSNLESIPIRTQIEPYKGLLDNLNLYDEDPRSSYVFPPDDRELVYDTTTYPWRTICKLYITAADSEMFIGSGAIIDDFHVLTCGHCAYLHEHGGWADSIEVIPAMDGSYWPYGSSIVTYVRTYTGWTESEMVEHDWAVLTLDKSLGSFTGWMGRKTENPSSSIYTDMLNTAGYPGDLYYGEYMYRASDYGDRADEYNHWFWIDIAGGQSGSPIWTYDGANRYILSILAYEYLNGVDANFGTRLNTNKFNDINTWLSQDATSPPNDKAELLIRDDFTYISDTKVISGQSYFIIYYEVENTGTKMATNFNVNFYASEDTSISSSDYLIGISTITSLNALDYAFTDWEGAFPTSIPSGKYYIGWIIDKENTVDEFNENNNVGFINSETISVQDPPFNPIGLILIISIIGLVIVTLALLIRSTVRNIPDLDFKYDYSNYFEGYHNKNVIYNNMQQEAEPPKNELSINRMKFCTNCGYSLGVKQSNFCPSCGTQIKE